jgi:hypothetical protein
MSVAKKQNFGHSVFRRILAYAKANGEDFNLLLFRYGVERLLYRLRNVAVIAFTRRRIDLGQICSI